MKRKKSYIYCEFGKFIKKRLVELGKNVKWLSDTADISQFTIYACGASIKVIPSDYLPKNTNFLITHPCATVSPIKLSEYKIHDKPQGLSGWLIEGRVFYDAFVLNNKKKAIAISKKIEEPGEDNTSESGTESGT